MPDDLFRVGRVLVDLIGLGFLGFALYSYVELRRRTKCTRELADHVRRYYEERERGAASKI